MVSETYFFNVFYIYQIARVKVKSWPMLILNANARWSTKNDLLCFTWLALKGKKSFLVSLDSSFTTTIARYLRKIYHKFL